MTYEYYAIIDRRRWHEHPGGTRGLAAGFADEVTVWSHVNRRLAQDEYRAFASSLSPNVPDVLRSETRHRLANWTHLEIAFTLTSPWYSKDDRPFHVLDNPVRKERVFGVPFMSAASWKGLLRWACRMEAGLLDHLEEHDGRMKGWHEPDWTVHLFGNERGEGEEFSRGALQFFPTWFDRVGFEVINPHSRKKRAGTQPIVYEVVPTGTSGRLRLLHAPAPGRESPPEAMPKLVCAIEKLLTVYGFSAKRTAGWGLAELRSWSVNGKVVEDIHTWARGDSAKGEE